ncbi:thioesterase II family protein [Streptomyces sp. NPDC006259]|uniref:thioesterase II family protein n=1 Tax=Streptomyces sp. NPDC006259 TaxID=3364740 RepID=UPI0036BFBFE9
MPGPRLPTSPSGRQGDALTRGGRARSHPPGCDPRPLRLFTFHHAGGSPSAFSGWRKRLAPETEVVPVSLPGRGRDGRSPRYHDMTSLVEALAEDLGPDLEGPHAFYGHSMGALVAYRLTRLRAGSGRRLPARLMVGAFAAPHLFHGFHHTRQPDDDELRDWLVAVSGRSTALAALIDDGDDLGDSILTRLREDLRLCAGAWEGDAPSPLACPVDVFTGIDDPLVPVADAARWSFYSSAGTTVYEIPGGHFFPRESKADFFRALRSALRPVCNC